MSPIYDLQKRFRELGRLRMGRKGDRGQPQKLGTWRLTSPAKELIERAAELYGGEVLQWGDAPGEGKQWEVILATDSLDVVIPPGEFYDSYYELWSGGGCQRRCDGERQLLRDVPCSCPKDIGERAEASKKGQACKPTTRIKLILPRVPDIGIWRLETHGYNAAVEIPGFADMVKMATEQGKLVPALLTIEQRYGRKEGVSRHYVVPVLKTSATIGQVLHELTEVDAAGMLQMKAPVERRALPGVAPTPDNRDFENVGTEEASMPGIAPPAEPEPAYPEWIEELRKDFNDAAIVAEAEAYRQSTGRGVPLVALRGVARASEESAAEITRRLREKAAKSVQVRPGAAPSAFEDPPEGDDTADAEVVVDNPCPHCGSECLPWQGGNPRAPKWRCTNPECGGGQDGTPWVSFHNNPWKPGGEIESMNAEEPETDDPPPQPSQTVEQGGEETQPPATPSLLDDHDTERCLELLDAALDSKLVKWADVSKQVTFAMPKLGVPVPNPPGNRTGLKNQPVELLRELVRRLDLEKRLEGVT